MDKKDVIKEISISLSRLGLFFSEETKEFLWEMDLETLFTILKFLTRVSKFYSKKAK